MVGDEFGKGLSGCLEGPESKPTALGCWKCVFLSGYQLSLLVQSQYSAEGSFVVEAGRGLKPHALNFSIASLSDFSATLEDARVPWNPV